MRKVHSYSFQRSSSVQRRAEWWMGWKRRREGGIRGQVKNLLHLNLIWLLFANSFLLLALLARLGVLGCIEDLYLHNCNSPRMRQFQGDFFVSLEEKCMQIYLFHFHVHARRRCNIVQTAQHDITFFLADQSSAQTLFRLLCCSFHQLTARWNIRRKKMYVQDCWNKLNNFNFCFSVCACSCLNWSKNTLN